MRKEMCIHDILELQKNVACHRHEPSYKKLFLHFHLPLRHLAYSFTGVHESAEEIVCDVMLKVWTMKAALLNIKDLRLYLYQAVRNTAINELKKSSRYTSTCFQELETESDWQPHNPEEILIKDELARRMALGINKLPPKCRMVYRLVREEGFTYKEVGLILGISDNTVDRHLNNALHKLMHTIKDYFIS